MKFDERTKALETFELRPGDEDGTSFPHIKFERHKPLGEPVRWSHESLGGGFSFVNPATRRHPNGFLAPIENQGEVWFDSIDKGGRVKGDSRRNSLQIKTDCPELAPLQDADWRLLMYGRNFQAVAKKGSPIPV